MNSLIESDSDVESSTGNTCSICLNEIEEGERVKIIKCCNISCHYNCADRYFKMKISCPVCKVLLVPKMPIVSQPYMTIFIYFPNNTIQKTYWNPYTTLYMFMKFLTHFPNTSFDTLFVKISSNVYKATESYLSLQLTLGSLLEMDEQIVFVNRVS